MYERKSFSQFFPKNNLFFFHLSRGSYIVMQIHLSETKIYATVHQCGVT